LRIVLSNIGTFGDINPLIAIALELKKRGHVPVMAVPAVFEPKIVPLGLEFHAVRPDIDPNNTLMAEMVYDVRKGTERGLREFLFPALRETYADLLDAATKPERADLLLLGELNYAGPIVAEVTGIKWASYVLAPLSFFSAFDPPVLPMYPRLARADKVIPGMGRAIRRLARLVSRKWPQPIYDLRAELGLPKGENPLFDAKHSPYLVLALFSKVLGREQKDWPRNTLITGFCYYDSDAGNAALAPHIETAGFGGSAGSGAILRVLSQSSRQAGRARGAAYRLRSAQQAPPSSTREHLCGGICALFQIVFARVARGPSRRGGYYGAMPAGGQAHAHPALFARSA